MKISTSTKWFINPGEEPDSVCITVKLWANLDISSPKNLKTCLTSEVITQDSEEDIRNAHVRLNNELLVKII